MDELTSRLQRLFSAIQATFETDLKRFPAHIRANAKSICIMQDFSGGMSVSEMENVLQTLISLVGSLEYHLQKWAHKNNRTPNQVKWTFETSESLKIIHDLWNNEKHGYPPAKGRDRTGRKPRLTNVRRAMRLQTRAEKGSWCAIQMGRDGTPIASGDGSAGVIISGEVVDERSAVVGDIYDIIEQAIGVCEKLFSDLGIRRASA